MIVSTIQTKGGVGKTTLALGITSSKILEKKFPRRAIIELDPQGTISKWVEDREASGLKPRFSFYHLSDLKQSELADKVGEIEADHDFIFFDVPGESVAGISTQVACFASDICLIPMRTSFDDEVAFRDKLLPIVHNIYSTGQNPNLIIRNIITFTHTSQNMVSVIEHMNSILEEEGVDYIECLDTPLPNRPIFEQFKRGGYTLHDSLKEVANNSRESKRVKQGIADVDAIVRNLLTL